MRWFIELGIPFYLFRHSLLLQLRYTKEGSQKLLSQKSITNKIHDRQKENHFCFVLFWFFVINRNKMCLLNFILFVFICKWTDWMFNGSDVGRSSKATGLLFCSKLNREWTGACAQQLFRWPSHSNMAQQCGYFQIWNEKHQPVPRVLFVHQGELEK